jgi:hypothetical protein
MSQQCSVEVARMSGAYPFTADHLLLLLLLLHALLLLLLLP